MEATTELPIRPLECWPKLKEMRKNFFLNTWRAKERGHLLFIGAGALNMHTSLPQGLGETYSLAHGIYFARLMRDTQEAVKTHEAADAHGYSRDLCSTLRMSMGQVFRDMFTRPPWGGEVKPDFVLEPVVCIAQSKCSQVHSEEFQIPFISYEIPFIVDPGDQEEVARTTTYLVNQMEEAIEKMAKATGRRYDDGRLIEGVYNEWQASVIWAKLCDLQKTVPAPLDDRALQSICSGLYIAGKHRPETVEFMKMLYQETLERVKDGISAVGMERCRLLHEGQPMWYFIRFLRYPNRYGAVFLGGRFTFANHGAYDVDEGGSWRPSRDLKERGVVLRTRRDALKALAELSLLHAPMTWMPNITRKVDEHIRLAQDWKANGVVFHLDLGCKMVAGGHMEARTALQQMGIPTLTYESSSSDPRDLSRAQVLDRLDAFLEQLGLTKLAS